MPQVRKLPGYMIIMDFGRHRVYLLGSFLHLLSSSLGAPTHELTTAPLNAMNLVFEMPPEYTTCSLQQISIEMSAPQSGTRIS